MKKVGVACLWSASIVYTFTTKQSQYLVHIPTFKRKPSKLRKLREFENCVVIGRYLALGLKAMRSGYASRLGLICSDVPFERMQAKMWAQKKGRTF
jgi:hypothetical protein